MSPPPFNIEDSLRRHGDALRRLARALLRDDADADDAVQKVWLGAMQRPPADGRSVGGWLSTSLHNVARKMRRGDARRARRQAAAARSEATEDHVAMLAREEQAHRLVAAVSALEPPYRDVVWQRYFEGVTPREIAQANGEPLATVRSRLQRGLEKLRARLGRDDESDWRGALAVAFGITGVAPSASATAMAWQGVTIMTTWTKVVVGLAVAAALVWWIRDPSVAPERLPGAVPEGATAAAPLHEPAEDTEDATVERVPLAPSPVALDPGPDKPTFQEVRVLHDETGETVAGATVRFVRPDFVLNALSPEQQERYSRSTESYLRDFGVHQVTDAEGIARIPTAAAQRAVVARSGNLYGTKRVRTESGVQEIRISAHHTLIVETADAHGHPVPHVKVVGQSTASLLSLGPFGKWVLGTTDERGILTYVLKPPNEPASQRISLHAELLDGAHGRQEIDLTAPPAFVRLTLPSTGTVRAKITYAGGAPLDRHMLSSMRAELSVVGSEPRVVRFDRPDADGNARFENIALGKTLSLRFPGLVLEPMVFEGPTPDQREVDVAQTVHPRHPYITGTLSDSSGNPITDKRFSIFCRQSGTLLASVGANTDEQGRFLAHLSDRCTDQHAVELTLGMDMTGTSFAREARISVEGLLQGRLDLGEVVMPDGE